MKSVFILLGIAALASPVAPQGCATVGVGVTYKGQHGDYQIMRTIEDGKPPRWDVLVGIDGKTIIPPEQ